MAVPAVSLELQVASCPGFPLHLDEKTFSFLSSKYKVFTEKEEEEEEQGQRLLLITRYRKQMARFRGKSSFLNEVTLKLSSAEF